MENMDMFHAQLPTYKKKDQYKHTYPRYIDSQELKIYNAHTDPINMKTWGYSSITYTTDNVIIISQNQERKKWQDIINRNPRRQN